MTPPEISRLEMDAAIAQQQATAAQARASIATLEHQRSLLGSSTTPDSQPSAATRPWLALLFVGVLAFAGGAAFVASSKTGADHHQHDWSASSSR